ncbi:MAG TPA: EamA family transporter [Euzebyales bacterium]|nr:EamA family transporter [Euzebyales bacterium]
MSGVALGALAGIGFGLFQSANRRVNAVVDVHRATFGLVGVGTVLLALASVVTQDVGQVLRAPAGALVAFAAAGFVHFFLGWTFLGLSQQRIGAPRTGALIGTTPLFGALAAALLLDEVLTASTMGAIAIVVAGVAAVTLSGADLRADGQPGHGGRRAGTVAGVLFALATSVCWSVSPLLIRTGLRGLPSPLLGVTIGMLATTVICGVMVMVAARDRAAPIRPVLGSVVAAGTFVGLSIWLYSTALGLAQVGVVLAVMQLSVPTVAIVAPLLSDDPNDRGGLWLWMGIGLILIGSVTLLLRG